MAQVEICEGDLLDQPVDAIVNSWNRNIFPWWLLLPQGVSGALRRCAGIAPFRELAIMQSELDHTAYEGEVRIVRFVRKPHYGSRDAA